MPGGIQRTPFDTVDLGSQLLQSLVAAQETKDAKERMRLQEKQLGLQEKEMQLRAVQTADPLQAGISDILGQLLGAGGPVQPRASVEERQFAGLQDYLEKNPDVKEMHNRIQATGSPLPAGEALDAARIAAGSKLNVRDRISAYHDLLNQYGSPAAESLRAGYSSELGLSLPTGPTLGERQTAAQEKQARVAGSTAEAARIRAQQESYEFVSGGFKPTPGSAAEKDPERFKKLVGEVVDFNLGRTNLISPDAASEILPTQTWARVMQAASAPPPAFAGLLSVYKEELDTFNKMKGKVPPEMLQRLQENGQRLNEMLQPPITDIWLVDKATGKRVLAKDENEARTFLAANPSFSPEELAPTEAAGVGPLGAMLGLALGREPGTLILEGRPLKPEIQKAWEKTVKRTQAAVGSLPGFQYATQANKAMEQLQKSYQAILPLITADQAKPPTVAPTLGALSSPEAAKTLPPEAVEKMRGLVAAYRKVGGTDAEAAAIESEFLEAFKKGGDEGLRDYIAALSSDIRALQETGSFEPQE